MVSVSFSVSEVYSPGHRHIRSLPVSLEIRDHRRIVPLRRSDKTADFPSGCVDQKGGRQTGYTECSRGPATVVKIGREVLDLGIPKESLDHRSEEHTSELQSLMRISYAVFCLKKKTRTTTLIVTRRENKII